MVEHGMVFLRERVFHVANGWSCEQLPCCCLVVSTLRHRPHHESNERHSCWGHNTHSPRCHLVTRCLAPLLNLARHKVWEPQLERYKDVGEHDEQHPSHVAEQHVGRHARLQELASLALVGLANKQKHGGCERGVELHEAVDIGQRHGIEHHIEQRPDPRHDHTGQQRQQSRQHINIEKQLQIEIVVELRSSGM